MTTDLEMASLETDPKAMKKMKNKKKRERRDLGEALIEEPHENAPPEEIPAPMATDPEMTFPETDPEATKKKKEKKKKKRERRELREALIEEPPENAPLVVPNEISEVVHNDPLEVVPAERLKVAIEVVHDDPDKVAPIVGYFSNGFNGGRQGEGEDCRELPPKVRVLRNTHKQGRLQLVVTPNDSNVDFVGTNYSGEAAYPQVCTYALGVLDKEAGVLKIVPIASNKIFRLEPRIGGLDGSEAESSALISEEGMMDRINKLTGLYGSKKAITQAKKRASLSQNEAPDAEDLGMEMEGVSIDAPGSTSICIYNIPPYDASATMPEKAYPLDRIIEKGEWEHLLDILELLDGGTQDLSSINYPTFVCNRINKLKDMVDAEEKKKLACIFSYISHLINFKDQHSMAGGSLVKSCWIPDILFKKFSSMFFSSGDRWVTNEKNDLLTGYVLVLTLYADEFMSQPSDIAKDLRMSTVTLRRHYHQLGCKFVRQGLSWFASLPVPLCFPDAAPKRGQRRRQQQQRF